MELKITPLKQLGENVFGKTFELTARSTRDYLLAYRKAGSVSGNHYHEGKSEGKNPEQLILVSGEAEIYAKDINTGEEHTERVNAPTLISIGAFILHTVTAITDISFFELNSLEEHKADTKRFS